MIRRTLPIVTLAAAAASVVAAVPAAQADPRILLVTLQGGSQVTVTVDAPPGTPVDQIPLPPIAGAIVSVTDVTDSGAPATTDPATTPATTTMPSPIGALPTTTPTTTSTTATTTPTTPSTTTTPADASPTGDHPADAPQAATDGKAQRSAQATTEEKVAKRRPSASGSHAAKGAARGAAKRAARADGAAPTPADPTFTLATPGAAVVGVPNLFIERFRIPPFLLSIYQAAGTEYGVRWEVLAAINEIETDYGRNLNVSSAGAVGWMQFMPATWQHYGVDANDDGRKDPYNPVDAIFAAARYLKAAGAAANLQQAVFAYNHAGWYVDSVLLRARLISGLPADFVGSLTGLTQGRFPVYATATYADGVDTRTLKVANGHNAAVTVDSDAHRRSIAIYARADAPVIAVQDGTVVGMGHSARLGRYLRLRDAYGNTYTYAHLGRLAREIPVPKDDRRTQRADAAKAAERAAAKADPQPTAAATAGTHTARRPAKATSTPRSTSTSKRRLFAHPARPLALRAGGRQQILDAGGAISGLTTYRAYFASPYGLNAKDVELKRLKVGSKVIAGTILGRLATRTADGAKPHLSFSIRPAGRGAPLIDPKPILDGWKLLESTAIYRAQGRNALLDGDSTPSVGQLLLMSKEQLQRQVLDDPNIDIYPAGRQDIEAGAIDRRVLATLAFLAASGLRPTVSSLLSGHSELTTSGNVSEHASGDAVDISAINGVPILGHQGDGSITDIAVRRLLTLQGAMKPHQIITLHTYPGTDNTLALPDHANHIHVGFRPLDGANAVKFQSVLRPDQWSKLMSRLETLDNPAVPLKPSPYALPAHPGSQTESGGDAG
jgi:murein DD-endopeptidase MepM/ murein hydrolase activator NlpD